jgi:N-acyl-D-amino-acid deacylase
MLDVLIRGGRVIDGAGNPWHWADVGIVGDRIVAVGPLASESAKTTINADGLFVCPGFIDMHSHSDLQLLINPGHDAKVRQGVTVDVIGQDGLSYAPVTDVTLGQLQGQLAGWNSNPSDFDWNWRTVAEFLDRFDNTDIAINIAFLVPHGTVRMYVMGLDDRPATDDELQRMKGLVDDGLQAGAVGLSSGLTYAPGMFGSDDELVELCGVMKETGRYYCPHHRNYGSHAMEGYAACIEIARRAGVPLHLAHAHLGFTINKGRAPELIRMVDQARLEGVDVTLDTYPYLAGNSYLHALLPRWMHSGGSDQTLSRLRDPALRERLRVEIEETGSDGYHGVPVDWTQVIISGTSQPANSRWVGLNVSEAATQVKQRPIDFYCDLLVSDELGSSSITFNGNEENVRTVMVHPAHTPGSDGILVGARPHPRSWGTFPRFLAVYVRQLGLLTVEEMVRKMTSLPSQRLGLLDRGLLRPGHAADVVCFDLDSIADTATYENPKQPPVGIPHVIVNGQPVIRDGLHTGNLPGRSLRWQRSRAPHGIGQD